MKFITAVLLTIATLASAAPNLNADANAAAPLASRQECVYGCGCQSDDPDQGTDPDTATCCASVGGTLGNEGTVRSSLCYPSFPWTYVVVHVCPERYTANFHLFCVCQQLCNDMPFATAQAYARCCGSSGGYVCFQSGRDCPPVTV